MKGNLESTLSLLEQAADWWTLLHSEEATSADRCAFAEWARRSPQRIEAYLQTARLHHALTQGRLEWPDTPAAVLIRESRVPANEAVAVLPVDPISAPPARLSHRTTRRRAFASFAATAAALALGACWLLLSGPQHYNTRFGEQRSVLLDDGSRVTLNTATRLEVQLSKRHRVVRLLQGEALFDVAHDATRPFDVVAHHTVLRAVGTAFDVDLEGDRTTVTVLAGRGAVAPATTMEAPLSPPTKAASDRRRSGSGANLTEAPHSSAASSRLLTTTTSSTAFPAPPGVLVIEAAERVTLTSMSINADRIGAPEHVSNPATVTAWTERRLVFEHRALGEVAEEYNRYSRFRIVIGSEELKRQEVTGVVQSDDPASFLSFLADVPGVAIREMPDGTRVVTLKAEAQR